MHTEVISIDKIKREAQAAVALFDDVNDACPYPFSSEAGQIYREEFIWQRSVCRARDNAAAQRAAKKSP